MSSSVDAQKRAGIWSYFGINSAPRRRISVSLPVRNTSKDPFEKPDRHNNSATPSSSSFMGDGKSAWMYQGQRAKYLRLGAILAFVILVLFFISGGDRARVGDYVGSENSSSRYNMPIARIWS